MLSGGVARRYAQALFELAVEAKGLDEYENELKQLADLISNNPEVADFLRSPQISGNKKKELLKQVVAGEFSPMVQNFVNLVVDRQRQDYFVEMYQQFRLMSDEVRNILEANVKSAKELTPKQKDTLHSNLSKLTGKSVRLVAQVDPSLVGGLVVKIGDRVFDGSVAGRLAKLKETLV